MKGPAGIHPTETNWTAKRQIDRLAALVVGGAMSAEAARAEIETLLPTASEGRKAWARGRLMWCITNAHLVGSLPRTFAVASTCTSPAPDWCGNGIGRELFAVACMQGVMAYRFQMAGSAYAKIIVHGVAGVRWQQLTREQLREIDRIKKLVRRFIERAKANGFMAQVGEAVRRPHEHDPAHIYALTRSGIETAERILQENPAMLEYAMRMGWNNEDGLPY